MAKIWITDSRTLRGEKNLTTDLRIQLVVARTLVSARTKPNPSPAASASPAPSSYITDQEQSRRELGPVSKVQVQQFLVTVEVVKGIWTAHQQAGSARTQKNDGPSPTIVAASYRSPKH